MVWLLTGLLAEFMLTVCYSSKVWHHLVNNDWVNGLLQLILSTVKELMAQGLVFHSTDQSITEGYNHRMSNCLRYGRSSYSIFKPCCLCFSAFIQSLLCLYPICCHLQSRVQGHLVRTYKAPFPAHPYCHHRITRSCSHCARHCCCWKPAN